MLVGPAPGEMAADAILAARASSAAAPMEAAPMEPAPWGKGGVVVVAGGRQGKRQAQEQGSAGRWAGRQAEAEECRVQGAQSAGEQGAPTWEEGEPTAP